MLRLSSYVLLCCAWVYLRVCVRERFVPHGWLRHHGINPAYGRAHTEVPSGTLARYDVPRAVSLGAACGGMTLRMPISC